MRRLCLLRAKCSIQYLKSSERTSCSTIRLWVHWSESHIRTEKCTFQMVMLKRQFIRRKQKHLHFLQSLPLVVLNPAQYHVPPTKRQLELQEAFSLVVTVIERTTVEFSKCQPGMLNVPQGAIEACCRGRVSSLKEHQEHPYWILLQWTAAVCSLLRCQSPNLLSTYLEWTY